MKKKIAIHRASLVVQTVNNPPATQETQVRSLGQSGPLEEGMATHSSVIAWRIPWTEESDRLWWPRVIYNWETNTFLLSSWWRKYKIFEFTSNVLFRIIFVFRSILGEAMILPFSKSIIKDPGSNIGHYVLYNIEKSAWKSLHISLEVRQTEEGCCYFLSIWIAYRTGSTHLDHI